MCHLAGRHLHVERFWLAQKFIEVAIRLREGLFNKSQATLLPRATVS